MTLLTAFNILLYRYSGQNDICVGSPVAGRQKEELEGLIGFFVNTIALRNEVSGNATFIELLQSVKENALKAFEYQDVPFEKIVDAVVTERVMNRNPVFQVVFILQNTPEIENIQLPGVEISLEDTEQDTSKFELTFSFTETPDGIKCSVEYCTDLYTEERIVRMTEHYKELLGSVL